jgi:multisubunit Na+/H+ antiporter MnhC subunit
LSKLKHLLLRKNKKKIVVGKVIVAKAIGIFIFYIGRILVVSNRLERVEKKN